MNALQPIKSLITAKPLIVDDPNRPASERIKDMANNIAGLVNVRKVDDLDARNVLISVSMVLLSAASTVEMLEEACKAPRRLPDASTWWRPRFWRV